MSKEMPEEIWLSDIEGSRCRCWNGPTYGGFKGEGHLSTRYIRAARVRDLAKVTKQALLQWKMYDELSCWPGNDIEESNEPEAVEWRACVAALDEINLLLMKDAT